MILNKSSTTLEQNDILLLMRGLNFAPTPFWSSGIENSEWHNAHQHVRRTEWRSVLCENETEEPQLPLKLRIPKYSRPSRECLDESTVAYGDAIFAKLRNLEEEVRTMFNRKNNLPKGERDKKKRSQG